MRPYAVFLVMAAITVFVLFYPTAAYKDTSILLAAARPTPLSTPDAGWLMLPDLPASATQADVGAEIYRLVCRDCHGDKGQGLTEDWIAQWDPEDQNCWQSKCHALNHPPEGFLLPTAVPSVVGPSALSRFHTASDLHEFISENMPWHNPGSLQDEQYWQLAAYLLRENEIDPMASPLTQERADTLRLSEQTVESTTTPDATNTDCRRHT